MNDQDDNTEHGCTVQMEYLIWLIIIYLEIFKAIQSLSSYTLWGGVVLSANAPARKTFAIMAKCMHEYNMRKKPIHLKTRANALVT